MEILTKENLVRAMSAPTAISRTFTPLLREGNQVSFEQFQMVVFVARDLGCLGAGIPDLVT